MVVQGFCKAKVGSSNLSDGIAYIISIFKQEIAGKKIPAIFCPITFFKKMKEDNQFILTPEIYEEVLKYYGYKMENGKFVKKPKIPEFEYFGKWKNGGFRP